MSTPEIYRAAFQKAVEEFNGFGVAAVNIKYRIDAATTNSMWGFKAPSLLVSASLVT